MADGGPTGTRPSSSAHTSSAGEQPKNLTCLPGVGDEQLAVEAASEFPSQAHWSARWEDKWTSL